MAKAGSHLRTLSLVLINPANKRAFFVSPIPPLFLPHCSVSVRRDTSLSLPASHKGSAAFFRIRTTDLIQLSPEVVSKTCTRSDTERVAPSLVAWTGDVGTARSPTAGRALGSLSRGRAATAPCGVQTESSVTRRVLSVREQAAVVTQALACADPNSDGLSADTKKTTQPPVGARAAQAHA